MTIQPQITAEASTRRHQEQSRPVNRRDPVYRALDAFVFSSFFQPRLPGPDAPPCSIEVPEALFLLDNLQKHRVILWVNIIVGSLLALFVGVTDLELSDEQLWALMIGAVVPLVISGVAWYAVSFSGIPERFSAHAMLVTGVLFFATSMSITAVLFVLALIVPWYFLIFGFGPLYAAVYASAVLYDNLDGLRTAAFQPIAFSRAQSYLRDKEDPSSVGDPVLVQAGRPEERVFSNSTNRLDHLFEELARQQEPAFANVLIADGLTEFVRLLSLTARPVAAGGDLQELVAHAHELSVEEVNQRAVPCLRVIVEHVHALLGDAVIGDMEAIGDRLAQIERLRAESSNNSGKKMQQMADFLFVEVFRHLVSVVRAHRAWLLKR